MSDLRIYIIEDEPLYSTKLEMLVNELGYELAGMSDNSDTARVEILKMNPDLLLVDVSVKGTMDGIELVRTLEGKIPSIFITSYSDKNTFDRAKSVGPHAYVTKPFDAVHLQRTIELAFASINKSGKESEQWESDIGLEGAFFIKDRNKLEKVAIADITHLEVEDRYSTIFTQQNKKFVLRMSMADVQARLPGSFVRVHRKFTVNLDKVSSIDLQDQIIKIGDIEIPISRSHKDDLLKRLDWIQ